MKLVQSATHSLVALSGLIAFVSASAAMVAFEPFGRDVVLSTAFIIGASALGIALPDILWQKIYLRQSTGLDFARSFPSWPRTFVKILGLVGTAALIGIAYWLLPEYNGSFYNNYYRFLRYLLPFWAIAAVPYFYFIDSRMRDPFDGYWYMGCLLLGRFEHVDKARLAQYWLGWMIKAFFMPLMYVYLCDDLVRLWSAEAARLQAFVQWHDLIYQSLFMIDVGLVCVGYLFSLRLFDSHLRSAEPTLFGWAVAIICYEPFWSLIGAQYLRYWNDFNWSILLAERPTLLWIWSGIILSLSAIYVWATVVFGMRFSNLTHRGIITSGPYRITKHPAYISKNLSWWFISVPFFAPLPPADILRNCALLLAVNFIYFLRAKTEERHLARDPAYVEYARWIHEHGAFRFLNPVPVLGRIVAFRKATPPSL